ncbi:hypothetical protein [Roseimaritima sediminicola]|uniref:hypothetical protein n=1 Tax=Roseimaritima sediminicola TaxID=2662066 RepID=UPI001298430E|nr:hypothetical protein [Roseimaritima sediminicola]
MSATTQQGSQSVVRPGSTDSIQRLAGEEPGIAEAAGELSPREGVNRVATTLARLGQHTPINMEWFRRGVEELNYAYFEAALLPVKARLREAVDAYLNSPESLAGGLRRRVTARAAQLNDCQQHAIDSITELLLADEAIYLAFRNRSSWNEQQDPLEWVASFIPDAVLGFVRKA